MLRSLLRIGIFAVVFGLLTGPVSAHTAPAKLLEEAFNSYCGTLNSKPADCQSGANVSPARQYLILEEVCAKNSSDAHCQNFEQAKNADATLEPLVLVLNHETGRWVAGNRLADQAQARIKYDVAGQPTVSLARKERIVVVVDNTNPLLYGAVPGKPTEEDVPELETIQKLLTTVGGGISGLLKTFKQKEALPKIATATPKLEDYLTEIEGSAKALQTALKDTECKVGQTTSQTGRVVSFIQDVELGTSSEYVLKPRTPPACSSCCDVDRLKAMDVSKAFQALEVQVFSPQDRPESCRVFLKAARDVILADPAKPSKVKEAVDKYNKTAPGGCPGDLRDAIEDELSQIKLESKAIEKKILKIGKLTAELAPLESMAQPTDADKARIAQLKEQKTKAEDEKLRAQANLAQALDDEADFAEQLQEAIHLGDSLASFREAAEAILAKRDETQKAAAQIEVFERRMEKYRRGPIEQCSSNSSNVPCIKSAALDLRFILEPQLKDVRQAKIQKHSVTVKPDSPYATKVVAARPAEVKGEYALDSVLRGLWGISASVIYTDLDSPTFGAVAAEGEEEGDEEKMVIAVTDETTRAGDIALLADFRLARWLACRKSYSNCAPGKYNWFGVEFGAGVSDEPAFFAGISLRPSRSWRVGLGYTYQQVKELQDGFMLGQEVASTEDIQQRDTFEGAFYVSLSFALDSLRLFSAGD